MFSFPRTDLWFSTTFPPETDGKSEVTIHVLENFLRPYIEHRPFTWTAQLPLVEFPANNAINVSTGFTPFYLNFGQHPVIPTMLLARGKPKSSNEDEDGTGGCTDQPPEGPRANETGNG